MGEGTFMKTKRIALSCLVAVSVLFCTFLSDHTLAAATKTNVNQQQNHSQPLPKVDHVVFIIPNHQNDMHDGTVEQADQWLKVHINPYVTWAKQHNSLLIITWDEDDFTPTNRIPTIFVGPMVKAGVYKEKINHYHVLRTVEDLYHLGQVGESAKANPIQAIWKQR
jgi:hypothetical protein